METPWRVHRFEVEARDGSKVMWSDPPAPNLSFFPVSVNDHTWGFNQNNHIVVSSRIRLYQAKCCTLQVSVDLTSIAISALRMCRSTGLTLRWEVKALHFLFFILMAYTHIMVWPGSCMYIPRKDWVTSMWHYCFCGNYPPFVRKLTSRFLLLSGGSSMPVAETPLHALPRCWRSVCRYSWVCSL